MQKSIEIQGINILLVEDNELDVRFIQKTFEHHGINNPIHVATDGLEALDMLRGEGGQQALEQPYLILLDLSLPRMNGIQFLQQLRQDPRISDSLVFVLTGSEDNRDREAAYAHRVAGYLLKSEIGGDFSNVMRMLEHFVNSIQFPSRRWRQDREPQMNVFPLI